MLVCLVLAFVYDPPTEYVKLNQTTEQTIGVYNQTIPAGYSAVVYLDKPRGVIAITNGTGAYQVNIGLLSPYEFGFISEDWYVHLPAAENGLITLGNNRAVVEILALEDTAVSFTVAFMGPNPGISFTSLMSCSTGVHSIRNLSVWENIGYIVTDVRTEVKMTLAKIPSLDALVVNVTGSGRTFRGNTTQKFDAGVVQMITTTYPDDLSCEITLECIGGSQDLAYPELTCDVVGCSDFGLFTVTGAFSTFAQLDEVPTRPPPPPTEEPKKVNLGLAIGLGISIPIIVIAIVIIVVRCTCCHKYSYGYSCECCSCDCC